MKRPFVTSIVFHVTLFIVSLVGIPFIMPDEVISTPVSVEILPISEITQTTRVAEPVKKPEEVEEIKPQPKVEKPKPPEMKEDKPPEPEPKPPEPEKVEPPKEELKPPEPVKKPEEKPKPPEKKEEVTKVEKPKPEKDFQTLLKNLAPDTPQVDETAEESPDAKEETPTPVSAIAQLSDKLTMSEEDALRHQLAQCWNVLAGAEYAENLIVEIRVEISRERMVTSAQVTDSGRYNRDTPFRAAADAAMRALRNPKCIPLAVPPDKYDEWKTTIIRFDPSEML